MHPFLGLDLIIAEPFEENWRGYSPLRNLGNVSTNIMVNSDKLYIPLSKPSLGTSIAANKTGINDSHILK
jgi:hypothetical protein